MLPDTPASDPLAEFLENASIDDPLLKYFTYAHLPNERLRNISREWAAIAASMVKQLPRIPERTAMLRKAMEAKDCAVRCALDR